MTFKQLKQLESKRKGEQEAQMEGRDRGQNQWEEMEALEMIETQKDSIRAGGSSLKGKDLDGERALESNFATQSSGTRRIKI